MKILLPVDGSACALRAVDHLIAHAAWFAAPPEIHLLHVHPPIPIGRVQAHVGKATLLAHYRDDSEAALAEARARLAAGGLTCVEHIHVGPPAEIIVKLAGELDCALVVMGTHGRGAVAGLLTGSVAGRVLQLAACPVLLVK